MVEVDLNVADVLTATGTLLLLLGVPAILAARRGRRAVRAADAAADAATASQVTVDEIAAQVRTVNGRRLAQIVEQTNRLLEVVDGRVHDLSKRLDNQGQGIADLREHGHVIEAQLLANSEAIEATQEALQTHLDDVTPLLREYLAQQENPEGG
jgi:hypothetical protein